MSSPVIEISSSSDDDNGDISGQVVKDDVKEEEEEKNKIKKVEDDTRKAESLMEEEEEEDYDDGDKTKGDDECESGSGSDSDSDSDCRILNYNPFLSNPLDLSSKLPPSGAKDDPVVTAERGQNSKECINKMEDEKESKAYIVKNGPRTCKGDDSDCYVIDGVDLTRKLKITDPSADVVIVADKGQVALRDFPHPRHLCGNFPFEKTKHESFCSKCFCCVCETPAPCSQWKGIDGHCNRRTKTDYQYKL